MIYRSELFSTDGGLNMILSREQIRPSGLVLPTAIASVIFRRIESSGSALQNSELILPSNYETNMVNSTRLDNSPTEAVLEPVESSALPSLQDFTKHVIKRGKEIMTEQGLVPVDGDLSTQDLSEQEIEAMFTIQRGLKEKPDDRPFSTGLYL